MSGDNVQTKVIVQKMAHDENLDSDMRALVDQAAFGILVHCDLVPLYVNHAWATMHGYTVAEVLAMPSVVPLVSESDRSQVLGREALARQSEKIPNCHAYRGITKSGETLSLAASSRSIHWQGQPAVYSTVVETHGWQAFRNPRMGTPSFAVSPPAAFTVSAVEADRFRDFAEISSDWFWELDVDLRVSFVSSTFSLKTGEGVDEIINTDFVEAFATKILELQAREQFINEVSTHRAFQRVPVRYTIATGAQRIFELSGRPIRDRNGHWSGYRGTAIDVTESHAVSNQLQYQVNHDTLTGLLNRREFERSIAKALVEAKNDGRESVLCYIDLDQFKIINDSVGHQAGDELLRQVAKLLMQLVGPNDQLARLGGDEFGLILRDKTMDAARDVIETLLGELTAYRFVWGDQVFRVGASFGLVMIRATTVDVHELMSSADIACYAAKDAGRNRLHVYSADDADLNQRRNDLRRAAGIREALDQDRFCLFAQRIVPLSLDDEHKRHFEILVRMVDQDGTLLPPSAFIPAAERYGLMGAIDRWVIRHTFQTFQNADGQDEILIAFNLSGNSLNDDTLLPFIREQLDRSQISPRNVCFEITETAAIGNLNQAERLVTELKQLGCQFALDDFGSGLSSFAYLKRFPVDFLKIDGCFVRDVVDDISDREMVKAINQVGHALGISTIAEFVESEEIADVLINIGVDFAQGYGIGKPFPLTERSIKKTVDFF